MTAMTWGSKPMTNTIKMGEWTSRNPSYFGCENQGTSVLTHRHMLRNKFLFTVFGWTPKKQRALNRPMTWWVTKKSFPIIIFIHIFPNLVTSPEFPRRSETARRQLMNILYVIHRYQVGGARLGTISCGSVWRRGKGTQNSIGFNLMIMFAIDTTFKSLSLYICICTLDNIGAISRICSHTHASYSCYNQLSGCETSVPRCLWIADDHPISCRISGTLRGLSWISSFEHLICT